VHLIGKIPLSIYYLLYSLDLYNMEATCLVNIYIVSFFARFGLHLLVIGMESWNTSRGPRLRRATMWVPPRDACWHAARSGAYCGGIGRHVSSYTPTSNGASPTSSTFRSPHNFNYGLDDPGRVAGVLDTSSRVQLASATCYASHMRR
jgi:hypothetical protein